MIIKSTKKISLLILLIFFFAINILSSWAAPEKLIVGTSADWPPFEWVDASNNFVGFDMDLLKVIAKSHGYDVEILDIGFDSLIPALQSGKVDVLAAGMTLTEDRAAVADASNTYWSGDQGVMVREDSELNIATALTGGYSIGA